MLQEIFCEDICEIIRKMLHVDFTQYKLWCCDEGKWIYIWTENVIPTKCPNRPNSSNGSNHKIYRDCIFLTSHVKSNCKILRIEKVYKELYCDRPQTDFDIVEI